jgi:hypothetical protein
MIQAGSERAFDNEFYTRIGFLTAKLLAAQNTGRAISQMQEAVARSRLRW